MPVHSNKCFFFLQASASISFGDLLMISLRGKNHKPCGQDAYQKCNIVSIIFVIDALVQLEVQTVYDFDLAVAFVLESSISVIQLKFCSTLSKSGKVSLSTCPLCP